MLFTLYEVFGNNQSYYYFIPAGLVFLVTSLLFGERWYVLHRLRKEILINNYILETDKPLMSLKRIYKRLSLANFNLNWFSAIIYIWSLLGVAGTYLVTYFINYFEYNVNNFGLLQVAGDNAPSIIMWSFATASFVILPIQIILNIVNRIRKNNIDSFYGKEIIPDETILKYKKTAKWKWIVILVLSLIILTLPVLLTYFILKKKRKKVV